MAEVVKSSKSNSSVPTATRVNGSTNSRKTKDREPASKIVQNQINQQTHKSLTPIAQLADMVPASLESEPTQGQG